MFFGTSTGNTEDVADVIIQKMNDVKGDNTIEGPFSIDDHKGTLSKSFSQYDSLIVGTPTWNTGADTERSGVAWDEMYYTEFDKLGDTLKGKKVGVFGLGDQESYGENYADATGELYDVFTDKGAEIIGLTEIDDSYVHEESKAIKDGKFVGLLCDNVNQEELTEERVTKWVNQLVEEGILDSGGSSDGAVVVDAVVSVVEAVSVSTPPPQPKAAFVATPKSSSSATGYTGYTNAKRGNTMWISNVNNKDSFVSKE